MNYLDDIDHMRAVTGAGDFERLDALDEIETMRSLGYTNDEIDGELDDTGRDVLEELVAPAWSEDDSTDCDIW